MAGERKLPAVGKVISGTHGYFWWNNSICYEITSFENLLRADKNCASQHTDKWEIIEF